MHVSWLAHNELMFKVNYLCWGVTDPFSAYWPQCESLGPFFHWILVGIYFVAHSPVWRAPFGRFRNLLGFPPSQITWWHPQTRPPDCGSFMNKALSAHEVVEWTVPLQNASGSIIIVKCFPMLKSSSPDMYLKVEISNREEARIKPFSLTC